MMTDKIEIEESATVDRPGDILVNAIIGNANELFEIRFIGATPTYWVGAFSVTREVYMDCLLTRDKDRYLYQESSDFSD